MTTISVSPSRIHGLEKLHDFSSGGAIEVSRGLIGEQELRTHDDRTGNGHALPFAAGQLLGSVVEPVPESNGFQRFCGKLTTLLAVDAGKQHGDLDVLEGGEAREQVKELEDESDVVSPKT